MNRMYCLRSISSSLFAEVYQLRYFHYMLSFYLVLIYIYIFFFCNQNFSFFAEEFSHSIQLYACIFQKESRDNRVNTSQSKYMY